LLWGRTPCPRVIRRIGSHTKGASRSNGMLSSKMKYHQGKHPTTQQQQTQTERLLQSSCKVCLKLIALNTHNSSLQNNNEAKQALLANLLPLHWHSSYANTPIVFLTACKLYKLSSAAPHVYRHNCSIQHSTSSLHLLLRESTFITTSLRVNDISPSIAVHPSDRRQCP
jgi:hypothetical protein